MPLLCVCKLRQSCKLKEGSNCLTMIEKLQSKQSYRQPYLPANARAMCRENNSTFVDNNPTIIGLLPNVVFSLCVSLTENLIMWCSNYMSLFLRRLYTCPSQCKRYPSRDLYAFRYSWSYPFLFIK